MSVWVGGAISHWEYERQKGRVDESFKYLSGWVDRSVDKLINEQWVDKWISKGVCEPVGNLVEEDRPSFPVCLWITYHIWWVRNNFEDSRGLLSWHSLGISASALECPQDTGRSSRNLNQVSPEIAWRFTDARYLRHCFTWAVYWGTSMWAVNVRSLWPCTWALMFIKTLLFIGRAHSG
jgi:hypothetical protein